MADKFSMRRARANDAEALLAIRQEPSANEYQPLRPYSLDRLRHILATREQVPIGPDTTGKLEWVIDARGDVAGWITLDITSREHGVASVGYTVATKFQGRGLATAAVKEIVCLAFDPQGFNLDRLEAVAAVTNAASRRVMEKADFSEEGIARGLLIIRGERIDHVRFGLMRIAWLQDMGGSGSQVARQGG